LHQSAYGPTNPALSRNSKPPPLGGGAFTPEIPTNAEDNYFPIEMTAFEKFINAQHIGHLGRVVEGNMARLRRLHQNRTTDLSTIQTSRKYSPRTIFRSSS